MGITVMFIPICLLPIFSFKCTVLIFFRIILIPRYFKTFLKFQKTSLTGENYTLIKGKCPKRSIFFCTSSKLMSFSLKKIPNSMLNLRQNVFKNDVTEIMLFKLWKLQRCTLFASKPGNFYNIPFKTFRNQLHELCRMRQVRSL